MPDTPERRPTDVAPPATQAGGPTQPGARDRSASSDSMAEQASQTGEQIKQQASHWAEDARSRGKQMLHEQKSNAAEQISGVARALRQSADQCKQEASQQTAGRVLEQAASGLEQFSDMLRHRDIDSMMEQAGSLMRRQPALFVGGAIAAGFVLSRFFKSSSEHHQEHYDEAYEGQESGDEGPSSTRFVTSAHADPDEVAAASRSTDSSMPGGRDY